MTEQETGEIKFSVEETSPTKRILKVEVPAKEVDPEFQRTLKAFQKKAKWPGFRPGKVPIQMIRKRMAREVEEDLLQRMIPAYYSQALEKEALDPVDMPIIRNIHIKEGEPLRFDATVYIKPPFEVQDYKGIPLPAHEVTITDEMVEHVLQNMRERLADLSSYEEEDHAVAKGDVVEADVEVFRDGRAVEKGSAQGELIEVGAERMLPDLEKGLLGMKKGEVKEIEAAYPEDYHVSDLAGNSAVFKVRISDIKRKSLPDLDDEFAKDLGEEYGTLEELRAGIRKGLEERAAKRIREEREVRAMDEVLKRNPIPELPDVMVQRQKTTLKQEAESRLRYAGMKPEEMEKAVDEERLEERARRDVAWSLLLDRIAEEEGLEVDAEELEQGLERTASESSMSKELLRDFYMQQHGSLEPLRLTLLNQKVLDFLLENAKVTEEGGTEVKEGSES